MARLIRPQALWKHKVDPRVMQSDPRQQGVTASDVSQWMNVLAQGAQLAGPIAGQLFSDSDATVDVAASAGDTAKAQMLQERWDKATDMGAHPVAAAPSSTPNQLAAARAPDAASTQMNARQLQAAASQAAMMGDRARAAQILESSGRHSYADVAENTFFGTDKADAARQKLQATVAGGRYRDEEMRQAQLDSLRSRELTAAQNRRIAQSRDARQASSHLDKQQASANQRYRQVMEDHRVEEKFHEWESMGKFRKGAAEREKAIGDFKVENQVSDRKFNQLIKKKDARTRAAQAHAAMIRAKTARGRAISDLGKKTGGRGAGSASRAKTEEAISKAEGHLKQLNRTKKTWTDKRAAIARTVTGAGGEVKISPDWSKADGQVKKIDADILRVNHNLEFWKTRLNESGGEGSPGTLPMDNLSPEGRSAVRRDFLIKKRKRKRGPGRRNRGVPKPNNAKPGISDAMDKILKAKGQ